MKYYSILLAVLFSFQLKAQQKSEVLSLGTFHFNFPNNDFVQVDESNQIDVLKAEHQQEIAELVQKLGEFRPTVIVVERRREDQSQIDSLYQAYLDGEHELQRSEVEQLGFRLAKEAGVKKLYCVDEWGEFNAQVDKVLSGKDSLQLKQFGKFYEQSANSVLRYEPEQVYATKGITAELKRLNKPENIKKSLGNYLIGPFKYENQEGDFFGVNFETGRWFNRNLKIFRNIQRIETQEKDRILVIFGAGHMNLLNLFFESSPEYQLVKTQSYL